MITETLDRLSREMRSFYSLIIMNMVGAGLAVAMGMAFTIRNVHLMMAARTIIWPEAMMVALIVTGGVLVFRWFLTGAEMMDEYQDVREKASDSENEAENSATELIVQNMAFYRDHKESIRGLILGSLATGTYFLLSATMQVRYLLSVMGSGSVFEVAFTLVGFGLCLALGVVGVYIHRLFKRYVTTWDRRLQESMEAEKRLGELLEGSS
ncbi:MAG: hypothetical protein ABIJ47_04040 [Candidatus Bathyarchaeota archaeon]